MLISYLQFLRSETPESDASLDSITIKVETMEHPVLATDAEMDEAKEDDSFNTTLSKEKAREDTMEDKNEDSDHEDAEERALSAMSIFSHDSDDDPTWAPSEAEKLKLEQKKGKLGKSGALNTQRKANSILNDKSPNHSVGKKGRGRPKNNDIGKKQSGKPSQTKHLLKDIKQSNRSPKVRISKRDAKLANKEALKSKMKRKFNNGVNDGSSSDDESIDISEKANRVEGAGGNDCHYFCRVCKLTYHMFYTILDSTFFICDIFR